MIPCAASVSRLKPKLTLSNQHRSQNLVHQDPGGEFDDEWDEENIGKEFGLGKSGHQEDRDADGEWFSEEDGKRNWNVAYQSARSRKNNSVDQREMN